MRKQFTGKGIVMDVKPWHDDSTLILLKTRFVPSKYPKNGMFAVIPKDAKIPAPRIDDEIYFIAHLSNEAKYHFDELDSNGFITILDTARNTPYDTRTAEFTGLVGKIYRDKGFVRLDDIHAGDLKSASVFVDLSWLPEHCIGTLKLGQAITVEYYLRKSHHRGATPEQPMYMPRIIAKSVTRQA